MQEGGAGMTQEGNTRRSHRKEHWKQKYNDKEYGTKTRRSGNGMRIKMENRNKSNIC